MIFLSFNFEKKYIIKDNLFTALRYYHNASWEERFILDDVGFKTAEICRRLLKKEPIFRGDLKKYH